MLDTIVKRWLTLPRPSEPQSTLARIAAPEILREAWRRVRANKGGPGADGVTIAEFATALESNLTALSAALQSGRYRPGRLRRATIAKPDGRKRKLAIPGIRDRVAQTAALIVIGSLLDPRLSASSFGYRPGLGVDDAIAAVTAAFATGRVWTLDADVTRYFDRVPHRRLIEELAIWLDDEAVLGLFTLWLRSFSRFGRGIAQGSPISPLLANLFLHPLDRLASAGSCTMVRYADDFVVLARSEAELRTAQAVVATVLKRRGLALNGPKTRIVLPGVEFVFLGRRLTAPHPGRRHA